ncbi:unnamed protein product [Phytomonas sp. EM1]|nr:unnamed protein product [Phytomonas sp. EM1]|eukprot:CCW64195.1 unnamed protein product [Phytomonas sp. isolate EM1]
METINPKTDALLVVDVQNDFALPTGALYVPHSEALIPKINQLLSQHTFRICVGTQDWHPNNHSSFKTYGGPWPVHCIRGTHGAALHADLNEAYLQAIIRKGTLAELESYSAFFDTNGGATGLEGLLCSLGVRRVVVCGIALDYCVFETVKSAVSCGFEVLVLEDLCQALSDESGGKAMEEMRAAGVKVLLSSELCSPKKDDKGQFNV